ncbi:MAG: anti-sigma factor family protein [Bryobacteraceae bacterium]
MQSGENAELLLVYCARRLDPATRAMIERHMQQCPDCRAFGEQQSAVWEALDEWDALPVSEDFDARLFARIGQSPQNRRPAILPRWLRAPVPLAAACTALLAFLLLRSPHVTAPHAPEQAAVEEVESAEAALEDIEMLRTLQLMARTDTGGPGGM